MNVWKQIDEMKAKYDSDIKNVEAAAKAYGFIGIKTLPHGVWLAKSRSRQRHDIELSAPSADELCRQMRDTFKKAEDLKAAESR